MDVPKEIVREFFRGRRFEGDHLATLRIDAGHNAANGPVLASRIQRLQDDEESVAFVGVEQVLQFSQPAQDFFVRFVVAFFPNVSSGSRCFRRSLLPGRTMQCLLRSMAITVSREWRTHSRVPRTHS